MKLLLLLLFVGLSSAFYQKALDDASDQLVLGFLADVEEAGPLRDYVDEEYAAYADEVEDDIKTELGRKLKEGLDRVLEKIKEAVDEGRQAKKEFVDKLKELRDRLREIKEDASDRGKQMMKDIREKARDYLKKVLEQMGLNKRATQARVEEAFAELNYKDILRKIKEHLKKNVDPELLKEKIEKLFDQGSELLQNLLQTLKQKGKRKLTILIDALLDEDDDEDERETRGIKEYWEKIKEYFKDLKIDLQEKYLKFGEWVKNVIDKGMEHSKDKMENIKAIANEFIRHAKNVSKEVGAEAAEFFRQYKQELGMVWDELKEKFQEIRERKE